MTGTRKSWIAQIGPGVVTGASDDDPSGIATYSQAGSQAGFGMLWTLLFSYPLMAGFQEICARIGRVTGRGLAANLTAFMSPWLLKPVLLLLLLANTINIAANLGAMAAVTALLLKGPLSLYVLVYGVGSTVLQILVPYRFYVKFLKWLCLALLSYVGILFVVKVPWAEVARSTFLPHLEWSRESLALLTAILGTTISPYLFFWQSSQEVQEQKEAPGENPLSESPQQAPAQLGAVRSQTWAGMAFSNLIAFFIMLTAAVVLHAHGIHHIQTSSQAAEALRPIAGRFAILLFSMGIIGTGLLSIPVLAGSSAYAVAEALSWRTGLDKPFPRAPQFYGVIILCCVVAILLNLGSLDPMRGLFWSAVINGLVASPVMLTIMLLGNQKKAMGAFRLPLRLNVLGWVATVLMSLAGLGLLSTFV